MTTYIYSFKNKFYLGVYSNILEADLCFNKFLNSNVANQTIVSIDAVTMYEPKIVVMNESYYDKNGLYVEDKREVQKFFVNSQGEYFYVFGSYVNKSKMINF